MKYLIGLCVFLTSFSSFAGGTRIKCAGEAFVFETTGKGPKPTGPSIYLEGIDYDINMKKVTFIDGRKPYDYQLVYQSNEDVIGYVGILKYIDGSLFFSIFNSGEPVEEDIDCTIGLF